MKTGSNYNDPKSGTQDEIEGSTKNMIGKIKEISGKALRNPTLEAKGDNEQFDGKIQKKVGEIKKAFGR